MNTQVKTSNFTNTTIYPTRAARLHKGQSVYLYKFYSAEASQYGTAGTLIRFTSTIFSEAAQAAMKQERNQTSFISSNDMPDDFNPCILECETKLVDIYRDPSNNRMYTVAGITNIEFIKKFKVTPAALVQALETSYSQRAVPAPAVTLDKVSAPRFQNNTSANYLQKHSPLPILTDSEEAAAQQASSSGDRKFLMTLSKKKGEARDLQQNLNTKIEEYEKELAALLGAQPILPEEKLFTSLRALAYRQHQVCEKKGGISEPCLMDFYLFIDKLEFQLRCQHKIENLSAETLEMLSSFILKESESFPHKNHFFQNVFKTLNAMAWVMLVAKEKKNEEEVIPKIKQFLEKSLNAPFREQLNCTLPKNRVKEVANKNLTLRSSFLLSQFKTKPEIDSTIIAQLERIDLAFHNEKWNEANHILCALLQHPIFQAVDLANEKGFVLGKLAAGVINLVEFFNSVLACSVEYRWINFTAVKKCSTHLKQQPLVMEKGQLAPFNAWVEAVRSAGFSVLQERCTQLDRNLKQFEDIKQSFEQKTTARMSAWLAKVESGQMQSDEYRSLCKQVTETHAQINNVLTEISLQVNILQTSIVILTREKDVPKIEASQLTKQLEILNTRIKNVCIPFVSFLQNFAILMNRKETLPGTNPISLFETNPDTFQGSEESVQEKEEEEESLESLPTEAKVSLATSKPSLDTYKIDTLEEELKEVFDSNNRRKIMEELSAFFKTHNYKIEIMPGKGSHLKIYIGQKPIIIPHSREFKVGTAKAIREDILNELKKLA